MAYIYHLPSYQGQEYKCQDQITVGVFIITAARYHNSTAHQIKLTCVDV
jgi:hypothetical protein